MDSSFLTELRGGSSFKRPSGPLKCERMNGIGGLHISETEVDILVVNIPGCHLVTGAGPVLFD